MRVTWILAILWAVFGQSYAFGFDGPNSSLASESFVRREGHRLSLDNQSLYIHGANQYYLFYKSQAMVDEVLQDAVSLGLNVVRTWAFCDGEWHDGQSLQPEPGVFNEATFQKLDYLIFKAEQLGLRLTLALTNYWTDFGGMDAYVRWSKTAKTRDDFYGNKDTRQLFKNYISYVLNRRNTLTGRAYKDEPAILMWELANEPRVAKERANEFYEWVDHIAGHIKSMDKNHLVSAGSEGDIATDIYATSASPHIDAVSFHLYPEHWNFSPQKSLEYIDRHIRVARNELKKPIYCGEFGIKDQKVRQDIYRSWYDLFKNRAIDGSLFWILSGKTEDGSLYPDYDGFTVYYPESTPLIPSIQDYSAWALSRSGKLLDLTPPFLTVDNWQDDTIVEGAVTWSGKAEDDKRLKSVTIDFGGSQRPAIVQQGNWQFEWNSREFLDGPLKALIRAEDEDGNISEQTLVMVVDNNAYNRENWQVTGIKDQDDGYNFIYYLKARNNTKRVEEGHFVARFFLRTEGTLKIGTHYEASDIFRGDPLILPLTQYFGDVKSFDVDLGFRSVAPGESIGFKGQLTDPDGAMRSTNDWSGANIPATAGQVERVVWLKDGQIIAGSVP